MSFFRFVFRNIRRNKVRTVITALLLFVFMFIFSILAGVLATVQAMRSGADDSLRLNVSQRYAGAWKSEMPQAYMNETPNIEGVMASAGIRFIGGSVRTEQDFIFGYAVQAAPFRRVRYELESGDAVSESDWQAFARNRASALVGFRAQTKHGWRVGQRATINTWGNLPDVRFDIVGTLRHPEFADSFIMHMDRMEELIRDQGKVEMIGIRVRSAGEIVPVARAIERHFQGRPVQVIVRTDKAFMRNMLDQVGDFHAVIVLLAAVVFSTCFLMTLNALAMSIRERTTEIALLRAMGFPRLWISALAIVEAALVAGVSGTLGAFAAYGLFKQLNLTIPIGFVGSLDIPLPAAIVCGALAFVLGTLAALISLRPAFKAQVAHVLRKVV